MKREERYDQMRRLVSDQEISGELHALAVSACRYSTIGDVR
jgi:hypothetical protein